MIGTVVSRPMTSFSQPHWNTATSTPKLAAIDNRMAMAALIGTRMERNTTSSNRNVSPMTRTMNTGRAESIFSLTSMLVAVEPVTETAAPVAPSTAGSSSLRMRSISSVVAASSGALVGMAERTAVSPAGFSTGGVTTAMPSSPATVAPTCASAASLSAEAVRSTTMESGPLKPGPKPSARRS